MENNTAKSQQMETAIVQLLTIDETIEKIEKLKTYPGNIANLLFGADDPEDALFFQYIAKVSGPGRWEVDTMFLNKVARSAVVTTFEEQAGRKKVLSYRIFTAIKYCGIAATEDIECPERPQMYDLAFKAQIKKTGDNTLTLHLSAKDISYETSYEKTLRFIFIWK